MQTPTISTTAARLAARFSTLDNGRVIFTADEAEPDHQTLLDMTFAAHEAGISEDYAYSMVRDVLRLIADTEPDDMNDTDVSSLVDVYTADLMRFIGDGTNWSLADEARDEIGEWPADDFMGIVQAAQHLAYRSALAAVAANWPDDESDDDGRAIITDDSGSVYLVDWSTRRMAVLMADEWSADGQPDPAKLAALADYELDEEITGEPEDYRHVVSL